MAHYASHCEQTCRSNFNRKRKECIDRLLFNLSLAGRVLKMTDLLSIAIDLGCISKAGCLAYAKRKAQTFCNVQNSVRVLYQMFFAIFSVTVSRNLCNSLYINSLI